MAHGTADGEISFGTKVFREEATVILLAGPIERERLGLVALVEGWHPIGALLAYAGSVLPAPAPYGGTIALDVSPVPPGYDAVLKLDDLRLSIGSPKIVYRERVGGRTVAYRPEAIGLPNRCPRGGFRFVASLSFQDGGSRTVSATAACPAPADDREQSASTRAAARQSP
jgi:hypothetical protein